MTTDELSALVRAYAQAKWGERPDREEALLICSSLDRDLRLRIDALGNDGHRLLSVNAKEVLAELEALEQEALREDALASPRVAGVRGRELLDGGGHGGDPWPRSKHRRPASGDRRFHQRGHR